MDHTMYFNPAAEHWTCPAPPSHLVDTFHRSLPDYNQTPLHPLPSLAQELGVKQILLKDESTRFALPAFKITGASWAIHRALAQKLSLPPTVSLHTLSAAATTQNLTLIACTEGNWGRAVARMATHLGLASTIFVPARMSAATQSLIRSEGAQVIPLPYDYDACVRHAEREAARHPTSLLVMDTAWPGYVQIPMWVVEGYATILRETEAQIRALEGAVASHVFAPVGVGSWAQAVVEHYKSLPEGSRARVVAVEPERAACLKTALEAGEIRSVETGECIMAGMNCGTVSLTAWPSLRDGADAVVTVTERQAHEAVVDLQRLGISPGPCGASTLAALRKMVGTLGLGKDSVVVLFSTEGGREYKIPE